MKWSQLRSIDNKTFYMSCARKNNCRARIYYNSSSDYYYFTVEDTLSSQAYYSKVNGQLYKSFVTCSQECEKRIDIIVNNRWENRNKIKNRIEKRNVDNGDKIDRGRYHDL